MFLTKLPLKEYIYCKIQQANYLIMLNKIHEITRLLTYSYTPENKNIIDNILNSTIERCESLYYKTVLYPQLETIWCEESKNDPNYYHLEKDTERNISRNNSSILLNTDTDNDSIVDIIDRRSCGDTDNEEHCDTARSSISCAQFNYKRLDKFNKNKLSEKQQYMLKDITVLIYIYVATQPISVFSGNQ